MCEKVSAIKAQKTRLLKKSKESLVDLYLEERLKNKYTNEINYLLNSLQETEVKLKDKKASKFKYMIVLASSLVTILILICILGL